MAKKNIHILYVDDNHENLVAFKAGFRRDYKIYTAGGAKEGMEILKNNPVEIIFADQRMPEMTGVEFLEEVQKIHPEAIRILLTGYADINAVIDAINKGNVYRYISKPWQEEDIRVTIDNAYQIYQARNQLKKKNRELKASYDELDKFVYSASHDLTAPISSIKGILKLAKMDKDEDPGVYIDMIERNVMKLNAFVQNILDYHRNKKGTHKIVPIEFRKIVDQAVENFDFYEYMESIDFQINIDQSNSFYSDHHKLQMIFNNLISNAIKFQDETKSEMRITVNVTADDEKAHIEVSDNGIGIPEHNQQDLFNMNMRSGENSGSGIGLYIVKDVLQKLQGSIRADSTVGEGSAFHIDLPNLKEVERSEPGH